MHCNLMKKKRICQHPKKIYIYKIDNLNKSFADIKEMKPDKSVKCSPKKLNKGQVIKLNNKIAIKYTKIRFLAVFIASNQRTTEKTYLNAIRFYGEDDKYEKNEMLIEKKKVVDELNISTIHHLPKDTSEIYFDKTDHEHRSQIQEMKQHYGQINLNFAVGNNAFLQEYRETIKDNQLATDEKKQTHCSLKDCKCLSRVTIALSKYLLCVNDQSS
eukprot:94139_1